MMRTELALFIFSLFRGEMVFLFFPHFGAKHIQAFREGKKEGNGTAFEVFCSLIFFSIQQRFLFDVFQAPF